MRELGVSQAQANFTKLLKEAVTVVDKKTNTKKAVILPYEEYEKLLRKIQQKKKSRPFDKFVGILDKNFKTDDERYNRIVNWRFLSIQIFF